MGGGDLWVKPPLKEKNKRKPDVGRGPELRIDLLMPIYEELNSLNESSLLGDYSVIGRAGSSVVETRL